MREPQAPHCMVSHRVKITTTKKPDIIIGTFVGAQVISYESGYSYNYYSFILFLNIIYSQNKINEITSYQLNIDLISYFILKLLKTKQNIMFVTA